MRIAIIGCGYVGSAIARAWNQQGHQLTVTTTTEDKREQLQEIAQDVRVIAGNDLDKMREVCLGQDVILLSVGATSRNLEVYRRTYFETAQNLVTALQGNPTVKQLIYTGTYSILGDQQGNWVDETTPYAPVNEQGDVLVETEQMLLDAATEDLKICILRLAGIYGKNREIVKIFRSAFGHTRPGSGNNYVNWIHLKDIVSAIEFARNRQLEGIYHLACDQSLRMDELLDQLAQHYQLPPVIWDNSSQPTTLLNVRVSSQKLKDLGFKLLYPQLML